jgi:hypothetical protein
LVATERGASHVEAGLPNQDAHCTAELVLSDGRGLVVAVADGHGHRRHFRSEQGSRFAVEVACKCTAAVAEVLKCAKGVAEVETMARNELVPAILEGWLRAVEDDISTSPFSPKENTQRAGDDKPQVAYGSTLLLAVSIGRWFLFVQIGDGDVVAVQHDGEVLLPVPADPNLDGHRTTSLCQEMARDAFRFGVVDGSLVDVRCALLATDGYGNSQIADPWPPGFGADLIAMLRDHDAAWIGEQLPGWVARCASSEGSGDDTTVALIVAPRDGHDHLDTPKLWNWRCMLSGVLSHWRRP